MGHEDELTIAELQEILNEEHQETQRNVSPSEQEEDERGPMPTSASKDLLKKWEAVRAMSSVADLFEPGVTTCLSREHRRKTYRYLASSCTACTIPGTHGQEFPLGPTNVQSIQFSPT
ncbi:uncharacterized protein TNCV_4696871 [Trichonephila clavipes]|nr:uncharacterized protein TNCV_4696871 [Trichonephila clavipes]